MVIETWLAPSSDRAAAAAAASARRSSRATTRRSSLVSGPLQIDLHRLDARAYARLVACPHAAMPCRSSHGLRYEWVRRRSGSANAVTSTDRGRHQQSLRWESAPEHEHEHD
ncbi:MAG: hypothetical protein M1826_005818 [Phylliscum demangeonii]|nr:MAG: hypothetical protein M1826_005818 [Phylliscum demangeonii]